METFLFFYLADGLVKENESPLTNFVSHIGLIGPIGLVGVAQLQQPVGDHGVEETLPQTVWMAAKQFSQFVSGQPAFTAQLKDNAFHLLWG